MFRNSDTIDLSFQEKKLMSKAKQNLFKSMSLLLLIMVSVQSLEVSKESFLSTVSKAIGEYEYIGKRSKFCHSGQLLFINPLRPNEGLRLSNKILFGPFAKDTAHLKEEEYCTITEKYSYSENSVSQVTTVDKCEKEHLKDESVSTQTLSFENNKIIYKSLESEIECVFVKSKKESIK